MVNSNTLKLVRNKSDFDKIFLKKLPPLSLYIHVPWCIKKCPYCDFNSYSNSSLSNFDEELYLETLICDLEQTLPFIEGREIISIFIGGGTPSILSEGIVDKILNKTRHYMTINSDAEIVLEANPATVDFKKFSSYANSGVNRFSLGIQTFNNKLLKNIGRIHNSNEARKAIEIAQKTGAKINLDIMFALPGQDVKDSLLDIKEAVSFETEHLSVYHLTIEPNTYFYKSTPILPTESVSLEMQYNIEQLLFSNKMKHYEISSFAKDDNFSVHNMNYWTFGDYIGIGPGAHSKISSKNYIYREARINNPKLWTQLTNQRNRSQIIENHQLSKKDLIFEFMLNVLRLKEGVNLGLFQERVGFSINEAKDKIKQAHMMGLLDKNSQRLVATEFGWKFLSDLQSIFI